MREVGENQSKPITEGLCRVESHDMGGKSMARVLRRKSSYISPFSRAGMDLLGNWRGDVVVKRDK